MRTLSIAALCTVIAAALGCAALRQSDAGALAVRDCVPEPVLYDWQRLDAGNVIVWTLPDEQAYHVGLDSDLQALGVASSLEFVDGNRDGYLCADGWDSLLAVAAASGSAQDGAPAREMAAIHYVSPVRASGVAALRDSYAATLGERVQGGEAAI